MPALRPDNALRSSGVVGAWRSFAPRDELWAPVRRALRPDNALRSSDYTQLEEDGVRAALCGRTTPFVRARAGDCSEERAVPVGARPAVPSLYYRCVRARQAAPLLQTERGERCHTDSETITPQRGGFSRHQCGSVSIAFLLLSARREPTGGYPRSSADCRAGFSCFLRVPRLTCIQSSRVPARGGQARRGG